MIGTVRDIMSKVPPPRAVFVDHPVGRTFGRPGERHQHEATLAEAIAAIPHFAYPGQIRDLLRQWEPDGNRSWEVELREEMLRPPQGNSE